MAALCPGVQYGLSSQENFGENKDLIFVKLTDSALRTIEEYLRNQSKFNKSPTIKFLGNEGQLSFPNHNGNNTSFSFSVSNTSDMEGPGGSLECLQQPARSSLDVLGPISHKIRIHANDDVYETTRHRMSVLEENKNNKCAREIKMNQTDIGRKVKVKQVPGRGVPPSRREPPPPPPQQRENTTKPSYPPPPSSLPSKQPPTLHNTNSNGLSSNGLGSNHVSSSKPQNKPSLPDIVKRPLKERLIHLLALRPFKKPELCERLNREGLREKQAMTPILKQIAIMKDNAYYLNRAMWSDVHEDWPFYSESERQVLKRRKPENLTPPGSSDGGSSGSGHSPTSTHPGSPPPPVSSTKRPGYFDGADGLPTKRPRISHYRKPSEQIYRSPVEANTQRRPPTDGRDASNMNPRSRESPTTNGYVPPAPITNGYSTLNDKRNISDEEDHTTTTTTTTTTSNNRKRPCDSHLSEKTKLPEPEVIADVPPPAANGRIKREDRWSKVTSSTQNNRIARVSPDSQSDGIVAMDTTPQPPQRVTSYDKPEYPDYITEYTSIKDAEQRRRYKTDFTANYQEYRGLHGVVEKVSRRFAELEERLKKENVASPLYKDIKRQIVKEYQQNKQDRDHQKAKKRFQYLHDKLSHIKRLVFEYDQDMPDSQY